MAGPPGQKQAFVSRVADQRVFKDISLVFANAASEHQFSRGESRQTLPEFSFVAFCGCHQQFKIKLTTDTCRGLRDFFYFGGAIQPGHQ